MSDVWFVVLLITVWYRYEFYCITRASDYGRGPEHFGYVQGLKGVKSSPYVKREMENQLHYTFVRTGVNLDNILLMNSTPHSVDKSKVVRHIGEELWKPPDTRHSDSKLHYTKILFAQEA
ncbi:hypothetical protein PPL_05634 [Heterostelium album PN500]|uniref:Uncharacterized protein n=1 Tax=Heterostelium pallidum (strain ATCC 26659 / Pp 5 / PN500) TaxID=670386 RepID=D3BAQ4_HETP5|nr:hypothetical protein PPL_05634 [Heterostelium album PN500]EFA81641.1 hypothetical protein PPL_05634 [Heterostelium album PN500]|eukprot:XP_020433758.1 hypothetical protein PPL_05634 [Heterostelium album PN500]